MSAAAAVARRVLVLGAEGALGRATASAFEGRGWSVMRLGEGPPWSGPWRSTLSGLSAALAEAAALPGAGPLSAVVCAAGGWVGGGAGAPSGALADAAERMAGACVAPAMTAAHVAVSHLAPGGLLVLVGSAAALAPTPDMLAYGVAKAATHHIVVSLTPPPAAAAAAAGGAAARSSNTLPAGARALGVLPRVLDTPANRAFMAAGADTGSWTPCGEVAERIVAWAERRGPQPASGTLHVPETAAGSTTWRELRALYATA